MVNHDPTEIPIYHLTHVRNLASIIGGGLVCDTEAQATGSVEVEIGDRSVKARRRTMGIAAGPGGSASDYVPFYFAPRSPMLYVIWKGSVPEYQEGEDPLIHIATDVGAIANRALPFVFSDGNCASVFTEVFEDLVNLDRVDWAIMEETYWRDTMEDGDRMRRRMAEFLVHGTVPWDAIREIGVKTDEIARQVGAVLSAANVTLPVSVKREWYYG